MSEHREPAMLLVAQAKEFICQSRALIRRSRENSAEIARQNQALADQAEARRRRDDDAETRDNKPYRA